MRGLWAQQYNGRRYAMCQVPDGTRHPLPEWMLDATVWARHAAGEPVLSLAARGELRRVVDCMRRAGLCHGSGLVGLGAVARGATFPTR